MTYTANQLISEAYYAAGVVSREFETVSGSQITDGLQWLNDILTEKRVDLGMLPYETTYKFTAQEGVTTYFIPGLIQIDTLVFYLNNVRYQMTYTKRNQFFGSARVENIESLPFQWYFERKINGGNLHIYFAPNQTYPMEIHGTFGLAAVNLGDDLSANQTLVNLGQGTVYSFDFADTAVLNPGQLVINGVDLAGIYFDIGSLVNHINTGIIPGVQARLDASNNFILYSLTEPATQIGVETSGFPPNGTQNKGNVRAATDAPLTGVYFNGSFGLAATLTSPVPAALFIDGVPVALNDLVLIKDQVSEIENGVYRVADPGGATPWVLQRSASYDTPAEIGIGNLFTATSGLVNALSTFVQLADVNYIGSDPIKFQVFQAITFSNFSTIQDSNYQLTNALGFDQFYRTYLRYALADRICSEYNYDTPVNVMRQLNKYEAWIKNDSRNLDLRMQKSSTLQRRGRVAWAFVNIGRGFLPPS